MSPNSNLGDRFPSGDVFFGTSPDLPRIVELEMTKITRNPDQPRRSVDPDRLRDLADSIAASGLIHPIAVKRCGNAQYVIIAGERRFRAYGLLQRTTIPAIVSDGDIDELALIENIQREDLSPIDEYQAIARLIGKHGYSQGDAALALGKSRVSINEIMSLGGLAPSIRDEAQRAKVSKSVLIEISRAEDVEAQLKLWAAVREGANTVRALRANKQAMARTTEGSPPIASALRAAKRFASAVAAIPATDKHDFVEVHELMKRLLALLDAHNRNP